MEDKTMPDAWIELVPKEKLQEEAAHSKHPYNFGFIAGMSRLVRTHPRIGEAFGRLFAEVMFKPGRLSRREREMIAAVTAGAQDCFY